MKMKLFIFLLFIALSSCAEWWKYTTIYEILPFSFKDSDGDGTGDLKGITSKLDHFVDLNIETLQITPIWESPFLDMGYDISDYYKIHPQFGTMDDFDELVREMKKRGMKLILDLVINHSSDQHEWFKKSVRGIQPYEDFYVWRRPSGYDANLEPLPPNKWVSVFGGSAWKLHEKRRQHYLHQFLEGQPDFDLTNETLIKEIKKIITFWLDKGIDGFRLDAVIFYVEDKWLRDDNNQLWQYNQPDTYKFINNLRLFLDQYNQEHGGSERIFVAEAHTINTYVRACYGNGDFRLAHYPYNFELEYIFNEINAKIFNEIIKSWIDALPLHTTSLWMTQDHDGKRVGSRIRPEYSDIFTMTSMMLPGAVGIYYGQEIAMLNGEIQPDQIRDLSGSGARDPTRLIMQWDDSSNAGFTTNDKPYLPPNADYPTRNVELQKNQDISHYNMYKDLSTLRLTDVFKYADFKSYTPSDNIFIFTRPYKNAALVVVVNFDHSELPVQLNEILPKRKLQYAEVAAASVNATYHKGFEFDEKLMRKFTMAPLSSLVLAAVYWYNPSNEPAATKMQEKITNEDGTSTNVQIKNGVVKVDGNVVYLTPTPSTKFIIKDGKIYANDVPIFDLVTKSVTNSTSATTTGRKSVRVEIDDEVYVSGRKVYTGGYYSPKVIFKDNKIFADGKPVYDLFPIDVASPILGAIPNTPVNIPKEIQYVLTVNIETTTIAISKGIVNVNGNEIKYDSPNTVPELTVENNKIFVDLMPLQQFITQKNLPTNLRATDLKKTDSNKKNPNNTNSSTTNSVAPNPSKTTSDTTNSTTYEPKPSNSRAELYGL